MESTTIDVVSTPETVGLRKRTPEKKSILCIICRFIIKDTESVTECVYCSRPMCEDCVDCVDSTCQQEYCRLQCERDFIEEKNKSTLHGPSKKYV